MTRLERCRETANAIDTACRRIAAWNSRASFQGWAGDSPTDARRRHTRTLHRTTPTAYRTDPCQRSRQNNRHGRGAGQHRRKLPRLIDRGQHTGRCRAFSDHEPTRRIAGSRRPLSTRRCWPSSPSCNVDPDKLLSNEAPSPGELRKLMFVLGQMSEAGLIVD